MPVESILDLLISMNKFSTKTTQYQWFFYFDEFLDPYLDAFLELLLLTAVTRSRGKNFSRSSTPILLFTSFLHSLECFFIFCIRLLRMIMRSLLFIYLMSNFYSIDSVFRCSTFWLFAPSDSKIAICYFSFVIFSFKPSVYAFLSSMWTINRWLIFITFSFYAFDFYKFSSNFDCFCWDWLSRYRTFVNSLIKTKGSSFYLGIDRNQLSLKTELKLLFANMYISFKAACTSSACLAYIKFYSISNEV